MRILRFLRTGRRIDGDFAKTGFGCRRLAARIHDIKGHAHKRTMLKPGEEIITELIQVGLDGATVAEYYLSSDAQLRLPL